MALSRDSNGNAILPSVASRLKALEDAIKLGVTAGMPGGAVYPTTLTINGGLGPSVTVATVPISSLVPTIATPATGSTADTSYVDITITPPDGFGADQIASYEVAIQESGGQWMSTTIANLDPSSIVTAVRATNVVTVNTTYAHQLIAGQSVIITGIADATMNGTFTLTGSSGTQFTYSSTGSNSTSSGGTVKSNSSVIRFEPLRPGIGYSAKARIWTRLGQTTAWSTPQSFTAAADATGPSSAPSGFKATFGYRTVLAQWTDMTERDVQWGAGSYELQMDTVNTFNSVNLRTLRTAGTIAGFDDIPAAFSITNIVRSGSQVTLTTGSTHSFQLGQQIIVSGTTNFNGTSTIDVSVGSNTVVYTSAGTAITETEGTVTLSGGGATGTFYLRLRGIDSSGNASPWTSTISGTLGKVTGSVDIVAGSITVDQLSAGVITAVAANFGELSVSRVKAGTMVGQAWYIGPGFGINSIVRSGNVVTLTTTLVPGPYGGPSAHSFAIGQSVTITGVTGGSPSFNGTFVITGVTENTITYGQTGNNISGTVSSGVVAPTGCCAGFIRSTNYQASYTDDLGAFHSGAGFSIMYNGNAEFNDIVARGTIYADAGYFRGSIEAENGYFRGDITGATGMFTGAIGAGSGTIGSWIIEPTRLLSPGANPGLILDATTGSLIFEANDTYAARMSGYTAGSLSGIRLRMYPNGVDQNYDVFTILSSPDPSPGVGKVVNFHDNYLFKAGPSTFMSYQGQQESVTAAGLTAGYRFQSRTEAGRDWVMYSADGFMRFYNNAVGNVLEIDNAGTTVRFLRGLAQFTSSTGVIYSGGQIGIPASQRKYKENIVRLSNRGFDQLLPVSFDWKEEIAGDERKSFGFIAEDVAEIHPELASWNDLGDGIAPTSLNTNAILALVVAEVQSIKARLAELGV